jgi:hypothetical protein
MRPARPELRPRSETLDNRAISPDPGDQPQPSVNHRLRTSKGNWYIFIKFFGILADRHSSIF